MLTTIATMKIKHTDYNALNKHPFLSFLERPSPPAHASGKSRKRSVVN